MGLDLDCEDHGVLTREVAEPAIEALGNEANLLHLTPHGIRAIFVFDQRVTDRDLFCRAARGAARLVTQALTSRNITGLKVDTGPTEDLARLLFAPNATVNCRHSHPECTNPVRQADVFLFRTECWSPKDLASRVPATPQTNSDRAGSREEITGPVDVAAALLRAGWQETKKDIIFMCPLPGHADEHPSARFNRAKGKWYCDVCQKGGGWKRLARLLGFTKSTPRGPKRGNTTQATLAGGGRRRITYRTKARGDTPLHELAPPAIHEIATRHPDAVYTRGGALVRTTREELPGPKKIERGSGLRITAMPDGALRELMGAAVQWIVVRERQDGTEYEVETWPPFPVLCAVRDRGEWEGIRPLVGVLEAPSVRPDGSLIDEPGYDKTTGLLYIPSRDHPRVPNEPTREEVVAAVDTLFAPFREFPLQTEADRASLLALMLTIATRPWVCGGVPHWLVVAPAFGAGKSLLLLAASIAMTGVTPDIMAPVGGRSSDAEAEMRKRITTLVMEAPRVAIIDNLPDGSTFESEAFAALLTSTRWKDRILGKNESISLPHEITWISTGCNVRLWGDLARRSLSIAIDPQVESPHLRTFEIEDLQDHVRAEHPNLLHAALTIARGFIAAGGPSHGKPTLGMYEPWDRRIRALVIWATGLQGRALDPLDTAARLQEEAPDRVALAELLEAWHEVFSKEEAVPVKELVKHGGFTQRLREAAMGIGGAKKGELDSRALGNRLRVFAGQVHGGLMLRKYGDRQGSTLWQVVQAGDGGSRGSRESSAGSSDSSYAPAPARARENSSTSPTRPTGSSRSTETPPDAPVIGCAAAEAAVDGPAHECADASPITFTISTSSEELDPYAAEERAAIQAEATYSPRSEG